MKKRSFFRIITHTIVYVLIVLLILFIIYILHNKKNTDVNQSQIANVIEKGEYYEIIDLSTNEERNYKYIIYNSKHKIVKEEVCERVPPKIKENEQLIEICFSGGTNVLSCQYYDIKNDRFSDYFFNPSTIENGLIVYMEGVDDNISLIIQDIFDKKVLYLEIDRDFSNVGQANMDLVQARFIDKNQLEIVYLCGDNQLETTEIIKVN